MTIFSSIGFNGMELILESETKRQMGLKIHQGSVKPAGLYEVEVNIILF